MERLWRMVLLPEVIAVCIPVKFAPILAGRWSRFYDTSNHHDVGQCHILEYRFKPQTTFQSQWNVSEICSLCAATHDSLSRLSKLSNCPVVCWVGTNRGRCPDGFEQSSTLSQLLRVHPRRWSFVALYFRHSLYSHEYGEFDNEYVSWNVYPGHHAPDGSRYVAERQCKSLSLAPMLANMPCVCLH